jgi:hypothetical protein
MPLSVLFACLCATNSIAATASEIQHDGTNDLRILDLLPNLSTPLAVDPGVPDDFVARSLQGPLDPYNWIYWGPKDVLKAYFENPASLAEPVLRVKLSANLAQTGPDTFSEDLPEALKQWKSDELVCTAMRWGDYPVFAARMKLEGRLVLMAWVGLNDRGAGWTLMFNLVYPDKAGHPDNEDLALWTGFLEKTKQLSDGEYFKARGLDMQEGYTLVTAGHAKLKMIAEKRKRDGELQVVVIPESSDVEFHYSNMDECFMGAKWKYGEPIVKVYGTIVFKRDNFKSINEYVTTIFFKEVSEFSFEEEEGKMLIFKKSGDKAE